MQLVADSLRQGSEHVLNDSANDAGNVFCAEGGGLFLICVFQLLYVSDLGLRLI